MSTMVKIELVGALRYSYKGEKYERNVHYLMNADRAKLLLRLTTDNGFYVFREVGKQYAPQAPRAEARDDRPRPVVDTTKTAEEQYDDAVAAASANIVDEDKPVVVVGGERGEDISEEEAEALLAEADEEDDDGVEV